MRQLMKVEQKLAFADLGNDVIILLPLHTMTLLASTINVITKCSQSDFYTLFTASRNVSLLARKSLLQNKGSLCNNLSESWSMVRHKPLMSARSTQSPSTPPSSPTAHHSDQLTSRKSIKSESSLKSQSSFKSITMAAIRMRVLPIRALQDNYMYLLIDESTRLAAAVDPVNASAMASAVADQGVDLKAILTTHHHYDHAHGNADMLSMFPELTIYGGDTRVQAINKLVSNGENLKLGSLNIECLATPCHTKGHICYYVTCDPDPLSSKESVGSSSTNNERAVFTGDTLFIAGCGRFFEGSSEQMDYNLNTVLGNLPLETRVFCGHEYTVTNLKFALSVEPQNADIKSKLNWAQNKVAKREPTVPSTIGDEKKINPFMRLKKSAVKKYTGETDELEVMTVLRHRKNEFQP